MGDPSLFFLGPVRQFFGALGQKLTKGRVFRADPLDFGEEGSDNIQSFVIHDPILKGDQMKDLKFSYLVTSSEGFYYRQEHEYRNLPPKTPTGVTPEMVMAKIKAAQAFAEGFAKGKDDDGLEMVMSMTADGVGSADVVVRGVSYKELSRFQRFVQDLSDDVVSWGEAMASDKDRRRGWGKHGRKSDDD